ncbi:uncharacterized protein LOC114874376 [Osmia bicornis bicornis]|uniref:uncharacterized protein LOC114874376 n=1 Tax=Osmia bicornis bicornis TaxID=1437191 RepID=UPI001EAE898D|nr:uncharacterized protein LOC114874376 [Osmia bicornis bicornis]
MLMLNINKYMNQPNRGIISGRTASLIYDYYYRRISPGRQKARVSKSSFDVESKDTGPKKVPKDRKLTSNLPKDAAVHFGSFYGIEGNGNKSQPGKMQSFEESSVPSYRTTPRLEFTRQMVQKLERTAGTKDYARQVSALLEETVEPAHFKLHSLPVENSIPDGRYNPTGYPLWYKDPYKMSFNSDEIYKLLREKYDNDEKKAKDVFEEEIVEEDFNEDISNDEQAEGDENLQDVNDLTNEEKLALNMLSHECSSVNEPKESEKDITDKRDTRNYE